MNYISVKDASINFGVSERRVQKLCETNRIDGAQMISGVWGIPEDAEKPNDERLTMSIVSEDYLSLKVVCEMLSISTATGKNWIKLGKLVPISGEGKAILFEKDYIEKLKADIQSGKNSALKSRRNKKFVSGNALYNSYVSEDCTNVGELQKLLGMVQESDVELTYDTIRILLADCALHLFATKEGCSIESTAQMLKKFITKQISLGKYDALIYDLLDGIEGIDKFVSENAILFNLEYVYESKEDVLGLMYISCKNMKNRKATGSYYTPTKVVRNLIGHIAFKGNEKVLDPCCGTGNFLLQLPDNISMQDTYGVDIDAISVMITRINMALKFVNADLELIYKNISKSNYLSEYSEKDFDYIIGNPPWGYEYDDEEKEFLRRKYSSAIGKNIESYDVFIEQAIMALKKGGRVSFVLPEAIMNVKAHMPIRQVIINNNSIEFLDYLGNAFDGVQCPCIILQVKKTEEPLSTIGMYVNDGKRTYTINSQRDVDAEIFSFVMDDTEYSIFDKLKKLKNIVFLKDNADFALGIVTGNNKEYISNEKTSENEMVLKGADICKYHINPTDNYIVFKPESFQQIAPTEMYRAKEKLLYRFISSQMVFAYDDKQTLSLNSCNIVVPKIKDIQVKYVLAILNSRVAQFIYKKQFNSIKVLRTHIESIPIPMISLTEQENIIEVIDKLIAGCEIKQAEGLYDEVDDIILNLFGLNDAEKKCIRESTDGDNKFLA